MNIFLLNHKGRLHILDMLINKKITEGCKSCKSSVFVVLCISISYVMDK